MTSPRFVELALGGLDIARQAFQLARAAVVLEQQRIALRTCSSGLLNLRL